MISLKKTLCSLFLSLWCYQQCMSMDQQSIDTQATKDIVVDIIFFIEPDMLAGIQNLGGALTLAGQWLGSFFGGPDPKKLMPEFFRVMGAIDPKPTPEKIYYQEYEAPSLLYSFLIGEKTPEETLETFKRYVASGNNWRTFDPTLMQHCAEMTFDPEKNTNIMKAIPGAISMLKILRERGHTIHVLGNWNDTLFERLEKRLATEFQLINGERIISGNFKTAKGTALYAKLFEHHDPQKTIVIEPFPAIAHQLRTAHPTLTIIESKDSSLERIRQELKRYGAIS